MTKPNLHGLTCVHHTDAERLAITCPVCLAATLAAKDRLLERAVNALSDLKLAWRRYDYERSSHGTRSGYVIAEDDLNRMNTLADEIIARHKETRPIQVDPAPAPQ